MYWLIVAELALLCTLTYDNVETKSYVTSCTDQAKLMPVVAFVARQQLSLTNSITMSHC